MKKFYSYIVAALLMAGFIGGQSNLAVGQERGTSNYTITFGIGSGDGSSASTSTACSTIVSAGSSYLDGDLAAASSVYYNGGSGLKLGASSSSGAIKMNLSTTGKAYATTIVVSAKRYNTSKSVNLSVNSGTAQTINNSSDIAVH